MRFADRPSHSVEVVIDAPPAAVWAVATDLTRFGEWSPENRGGHWVDGATGPALGARFRGVQEHPAIGQWETTSTVVECEPERCFAWTVGDPANGAATWRFDLAGEGGGTRVRFSAVMGPGPSGTTMAIDRMPDKEERIVERRLQEWDRGMRAVLDGIAASVSAG